FPAEDWLASRYVEKGQASSCVTPIATLATIVYARNKLTAPRLRRCAAYPATHANATKTKSLAISTMGSPQGNMPPKLDRSENPRRADRKRTPQSIQSSSSDEHRLGCTHRAHADPASLWHLRRLVAKLGNAVSANEVMDSHPSDRNGGVRACRWRRFLLSDPWISDLRLGHRR